MPSPAPPTLRLLYAATLAHFMAFGIYFTAIQLYVGDELGLSKSAVGLAIGAFAVSGTIVRPFVGRGIDRRGRRPFLLASLALLSLSSLAFLAADDLAVVVVLRLLQGVAAAAYYTSAAAAATDLAPHGRAAAIAKFSLFLYAGFALGPAVGEQLIANVGFAATWALAAALGAAGFACIWALPETGADAMVERRDAPATGRRPLLHPAAIGPGAVLLATSVGYSGITGFTKLYSREIGLESAGALYVVFAVTIIGMRLLTGHLADRHPKSHVVLPGLASAIVGLVLLAVVQEPVAAFVGVAAFGAGHALIFPPLMAFTVDRVGDHERGEALGSFTALADVGTGLGGWLVGWMADVAGFGLAYSVPAVLIGLAGVLIWRLGQAHPGPNHPRVHPELELAEPAGVELA